MRPFRNDIAKPVLMAVIVLGTLAVFWKLLDVVVLSLSLAVVLYPVHRTCSQSVNRYLSAAAVTALIAVVSLTAVALSAAVISENSSTIQEIGGTIRSWVENPATDPRLFGLPFERERVAGWFDQAEGLLVSFWDTVTADLSLIALKTAIFFASLSVFLLYGARIHTRITEAIPGDLRDPVAALSATVVDTLYAIYVVHLLIAALTFVIALPFFVLLGYGHVFFYAFLCAACELIPVLGSSVVFIFLGIYALSIGDIPGVLMLFFIGYIGVSALPEIYVRPVLMGRRVRLHPAIMLVGFFGGLITLGMAGFVLGPVLIVLLFSGYRILIEGRREALRTQDA